RTGKIDELYASHQIIEGQSNYIYITLDLGTYLYNKHLKYLREVSPDGNYTKDTYLALVDTPYIQYQLKTTKSVTRPAQYRIQMLNLKESRWTTIKNGAAGFSEVGDILKVDNFSDYLANTGLIFTRIIFEPTNVYDGGFFTTEDFPVSLDGGVFDSEYI